MGRKQSLRSQLQGKGGELRNRQQAQIDAAKALTEAAAAAAADSELAAKHATAVEKALGILDEAGVEL